VLSGPVALVTVEPVGGILEVKIAHEAVPVDFGHNGCGRNGEAPLVPARDAFLCDGKWKPVWAIDEKIIRGDSKIADSHGHGLERGRRMLIRSIPAPTILIPTAAAQTVYPRTGLPFAIELLGIHNPGRRTSRAE
jgi:hypothetical protein